MIGIMGISSIVMLMVPVLADAESGRGAKVVVEKQNYDFGIADQQQVIAHIFKLGNASEETLKVSEIGTDCSCTGTSISSRVIPPHESAELSAIFESGLRLGRFTSGVTLHSNDPNNPALRLTVTGIIGADLEMRPAVVNFNDVKRGMSSLAMIELVRGKDALGSTKVSTSSPFLTAKMEQSNSHTARITVSLKPGLPPGRISEHLELRIQGRGKPLLIPIVGNVLPNIIVEPPFLSLGSILHGKRRSCILKVSYNSSVIRVIGVRKDLPFLVVGRMKADEYGEEYDVVVQNDEHVPGGQFRDTLKLLTNDPDQRVIDVPVSGLALKPRS